MSEGNRNMEDFLKNKMDELENNFQDDWNVFEQKLERALFFKRLRIGAAMSLFLIATSIGIFGTSSIIDFNNDDEAPFGTYTEQGFQSSGSKSVWKDIDINGGDQWTPDQTMNISAIENEGAYSVEDTQDRPISISGEGSESGMGKTSIQPSSNDNSVISGTYASGKFPNEPEKITETSFSSVPVASEKVSANVKHNTDVFPGQSITAGDASEDIVNAAEENDSGVKEALAGVSNVQLVEDEIPASEAAGENIAALIAANTIATEEDVYDLSDLDLKEIHLTPMDSWSNTEMPELQIRMPVPALRMKVADKGPFISPLQSKSLWEFSIKVYPNFTFRKFKVDEDKANYIHRDFVDQVRASESGGFSLNIGLEVSRRIGLATYLKGGLEYISYNHSANFDFTNYRSANIDESTGAITSYALLEEPNQVVINDKNTYHYLNLPLSISYQPWASDHIRLNMEAGVSYMYFVTARGASIDYRTLEVIDLSDREFKNSLGSVNLRVGATYYISPQFNLGFEPTFVYFTNTIYTDEYPFEVIPYSVGLNLKLQVKLN